VPEGGRALVRGGAAASRRGGRDIRRHRALPTWRHLVVLVALAACSAGPGTTAPANTGPGSATDARPVSFMVFGDPAELAAYESLVQAFRSERPGTEVRLIHVPSQAEYRQRIGSDFAAGTPADVFLLNYRRYAPFAARGLLEPLDAYLIRSSSIAPGDFYPEALEPFRWRGRLTCIPQNLSSLVVYYNKTLFDAAALPYPTAGWTWDDLLHAARQLTRDTDGDGQVDQYGLGTEVSLQRLAPFVWQNGGEIVEGQPAPRRLALDRPPALEALRWFVDLQVRHRVVPGAVEEQAEDSESRFQAGRTAMFLNSRRGVPTYRTISGLDWDVAPLPERSQQAGVLHADGYCMPASSPVKDAAWSFIEFANGPEGQRLVARSGRTVPSLVSVARSDAFLDAEARPSNSRVFLDTIPIIRPVPVHPAWPEIEEFASDEIERAFYGQASVEDAARAAVERTLALFAE
jgi:multiple sugar transport system substrate-binding protein